MNSDELQYLPTHEWAHISEEDGAKVCTTGISSFAVEQLGDLTFLELPEVGRQVTQNEEYCEVESVKAVSSIYAPATGEVIAVNSGLPDQLETLNEDAQGKGWIAKIRITDESTLANLLDWPTYKRQCDEEG